MGLCNADKCAANFHAVIYRHLSGKDPEATHLQPNQAVRVWLVGESRGSCGDWWGADTVRSNPGVTLSLDEP